jgi:hypothetical protein
MRRVENFCRVWGKTRRGKGGEGGGKEGKMEGREGMCTRSYRLVRDAGE